MPDLPNESPEQSPAPTQPQPQQRRITLQEMKGTHEMLVGFREGVNEGSFQGKHLRHIALGLEFLNNMISQSAFQLDQAKKAQKEAANQATDAIKAAGGEVNGEVKDVPSPQAVN